MESAKAAGNIGTSSVRKGMVISDKLTILD